MGQTNLLTFSHPEIHTSLWMMNELCQLGRMEGCLFCQAMTYFWWYTGWRKQQTPSCEDCRKENVSSVTVLLWKEHKQRGRLAWSIFATLCILKLISWCTWWRVAGRLMIEERCRSAAQQQQGISCRQVLRLLSQNKIWFLIIWMNAVFNNSFIVVYIFNNRNKYIWKNVSQAGKNTITVDTETGMDIFKSLNRHC